MLDWLFARKTESWPESVPTTVHVTHPKSGSTWLDRIFRQAFGPKVGPRGDLGPKAAGVDLKDYVFPQGLIHPAIFLAYPEFQAHTEFNDAGRFYMLRDLRDTIVSLYYSVRYSHPPEDRVNEARKKVQGLEDQAGLSLYVREHGFNTARSQMTWLESGEYLVRYEDLLVRDVEMLTDLFITRLQLPITAKRLKTIVENNRFEKRFKRKLGTEDRNSHGRQGAPGNWRKHFTPQMARDFQERYGHVLIATGYAKDDSWISEAAAVEQS